MSGRTGLAGRTALVTGAAHGIGSAIATMLAAEGATVHAVDLEADPGPAGVVRLDVTDPAAVGAFVERVGGVDVLVNNAGGVRGQTGRPLEDVSDDDWRSVVDANLTSTFVCTRAVVSGMKARGWGRVVNISSGAGRSVSLTGIQAYATAKAGQIGLTRQTAHELGRFGITVNCVAPGFVLSNPSTQRQWEGYGPEGQAALVAGIAVRRLGTGEDIANAVRFFTAEESSWVTGQTIAVDGGHGIF
jgi:3-oxoacyl-[acyl-carrier protein] reductase